MRSEIEELINAVTDEADCIDDLIDAIRDQRAAMSERDVDSVNALMDETRDIFFEAQTCEGRRADLARRLAAKFSCEPRAGSLESVMDNEERAIFGGAVDRLTQSIFVLKGEMIVINGLIDQNEKFTSMLLSEFRRLNGDRVSQTGGADFRG
ncbi:MAG: flagellar export chaperone FlgN [Synergistaceae bacterium]|nr:flagellar export chaperone FlgN [Synergistaceae bacterium]MBQ3653397.1 flagellar export chaperone FlgN [Synergistaceae bacterium]